MEGKTNRLLALEGLRGVAAVIVVIFHALLIFYPSFFYGPDYYVAGVHGIKFENNLFGSPLNIFLSGPFAVAIFFVISGFVLTVGFFQTNDQMIIKKLAAKRYIRLMLPAFVSILIVWLVITLGLDSSKHTAQAITHSFWLSQIWNIVPNLGDALIQGVWGIFTIGDVGYNPVLWTMKYEILGSILVFGISIIFKQSKYRWVIYAVLTIATYNTWYLGFVAGMILADLYSLGYFPFNIRKGKPLIVGALITGLFLGAYPSPSNYTGNTIYKALNINTLTETQSESLYLTIGATLVLVAVLTLPKLKSLFGSKILSTLGKYTYSLYLVHMTVLFTVCTGLFLLLHAFMGYNKAAIVSILLTLVPLALVTYFFEKYVDAPAIRISGNFSNWLFGLPQKKDQAIYGGTIKYVRLRAIIKKFKQTITYSKKSNI